MYDPNITPLAAFISISLNNLIQNHSITRLETATITRLIKPVIPNAQGKTPMGMSKTA